RRYPIACGQRDELVALPIEERVRGDEERTGLLLSHGCKRCVELAFVTGPKDRHFLPERMGSRLCGSHLDVAVQILRIHEISDGGRLEHEREKTGEDGPLFALQTPQRRYFAVLHGVHPGRAVLRDM